MSTRSFSWWGPAFSAIALAALPALAADAASRDKDEQAIRETAKAYRAALAKGDPKSIAEFWTPDGDYIDESGSSHPAGELAAEAEQAAREGQQPKIKITSSKIRFLTSDVAVEDGASEISPGGVPGASTIRGHYHATWVKQDGRWRLGSLCEIPDTSPQEARLSELDWMVGTWTADSDGAQLEVTAKWNATGTFLLRDMKATRDGAVLLRGSQRIGRDPLTGQLRSWSFDSDGGYGEAAWIKDGDSWVENVNGVLADGRQTSAMMVVTFDGKDSFTRKALDGRIQGEAIPDQEVRFTRRAEKQ